MTNATTVLQRYNEISIHIPRGGDDRLWDSNKPVFYISIHIPRGGDDGIQRFINGWLAISIHIPRGGDDSKGAQKFVGIFGKGI